MVTRSFHFKSPVSAPVENIFLTCDPEKEQHQIADNFPYRLHQFPITGPWYGIVVFTVTNVGKYTVRPMDPMGFFNQQKNEKLKPLRCKESGNCQSIGYTTLGEYPQGSSGES